MNRRELFQLGLAAMVGVKTEPLRGGARSGKTIQELIDVLNAPSSQEPENFQCVRCGKDIGWNEYCVNFENCSECLDADYEQCLSPEIGDPAR